MRGSRGVPILVIVLTSVACGRDAPLPAGGASAGAGMPAASGSAGRGGSGAAGSTGPGGSSGGQGNGMCGDATLPGGACVVGAYIHPDSGVCECQDGTPCVCPAVGCVDLMHDVSNCGACGVSCGPTSTCNEGVCGPAPVMVSGAIAGCNAMTMVATDAVYFADAVHGTINELGGAAPLAMNEAGATFLQANGANLFWYDAGTHKIREMPAAGGAAPTDVYVDSAMGSGGGPMPEVGGFLVSPDGMSIYVSLGPQVLVAPVAGGDSSVVVIERFGMPAALALNGATSIVYPLTFDGMVDSALLGAMPASCNVADPNAPGTIDQTTCARLAQGQGELLTSFIAVIAGRAFWIDGQLLKGELVGPKGGSFDVIAMAQTSRIGAAAAAADAIYFADAEPSDPTNGFIEKSGLAPGSTPRLLARGQKSPLAIAAGATKVYWATSDCAILSQDR